MAEHCTLAPGAAAYAWKKVVMYRNLSNEASSMFVDAKAEADKADTMVRQHT
jgi:hypothetical protein